VTNPDLVLHSEEGGIAWLTLNRPDALNALSREVLSALSAALDRAADDPEVGAVVLTGAGEKAFSAGADIAYMSTASPSAVRDLARAAVAVTHRIETLGKPVVAAINGYALGGGLEMAEACTLRVAVRGARLGHPEVRIGAVAGWGGTTRLPRLVGRGRAAEMLLTGEMIDADEALRIGLVNRVVGAEELRAETERLARAVLAHSPAAVRLTWEAMHRGGNLTLEESAQLGADFFGLAAATEDFREGTRAFLEKTRPTYRGR
jgi:enoyl-CoA hydratase